MCRISILSCILNEQFQFPKWFHAAYLSHFLARWILTFIILRSSSLVGFTSFLQWCRVILMYKQYKSLLWTPNPFCKGLLPRSLQEANDRVSLKRTNNILTGTPATTLYSTSEAKRCKASSSKWFSANRMEQFLSNLRKPRKEYTSQPCKVQYSWYHLPAS